MKNGYERRPYEGGGHKKLRIRFDLRGAGGRYLRIFLYALGIAAATALVIYLLKPERQLMNAAEVERITDRGLLIVGIRDDMPGFAENGEGLEAELGRRFAEYLMPGGGDGCVKFERVTNRTAQTKLTDGSVDVVLALMERNGSSKFTYSYGYYTDECRVLTKPGDSSAAFEDMVLGYVQDTVTESVLDAYVDAHETKVEQSLIDRLLGREKELPEDAVRFTTKAFASYPDMLAALDEGKIDGAVMTGAYIRKYSDGTGQYMEKYRFAIHDQPLGTVDYAIAASGDEPAVAQLADMFIYELKQSGELDALLAKYGLS